MVEKCCNKLLKIKSLIYLVKIKEKKKGTEMSGFFGNITTATYSLNAESLNLVIRFFFQILAKKKFRFGTL